ncbi:DNase I-like protein [Trametes versicolor FP-101664 SS1]|uniref:DNase I-like protein n=1 Tax=Trametes versicolor (strain FP-101664) TaxID=717944 RepID=UPI000462404D|nr:DNase I-like protein [Trametes versicolor FP-101664 SS1]EIW55531.1 DNase I-like protein [Trametes versicolor FP-101664 SS1]
MSWHFTPSVQEAHLTQERVDNLSNLFATSLEIYFSPDPSNGAGARGVAFVVNKRRLAGRKCKFEVLVPGRAIQIAYPWAAEKMINVLNVYAPNAANENAGFWGKIGEAWDADGGVKPDVMLGDFNVVESAHDRFPAHPDPAIATEALAGLLRRMHACDSWRTAHPNERLFTYRQVGSDRQSRLDRIYVKQAMMPKVADWANAGPGQLSDHQLVLCSIANYHAPVVGKGRWSAPLSLLDDEKFVSTMKKLGRELEMKLTDMAPRSVEVNPQVLFRDFKTELVLAARTRVKEWVPRLDKKIAYLKDHIRSLQSSTVPIEEDQAERTSETG